MSQIVALADAVHLKARALPKAPDGRYDYQVKATTDTDQSADEQHSFLWKAQQRVQADSKFLGVFDLGDAVPDTLKALSSPGAIDDRTRIFNKAIADIGNLPPGSPLSKQLNDQVITLLYKTLAHPPATYLGTNNTPLTPYPLPSADRATTYSGAPQTTTAPTPSALPPRSPFAFRSADGSGNNALFPNLGKAGMPYARSVQGKHPLAPNSLPDPNLIFETLLKARDWKPHPGGNSAMTFAFASLVTHMLFRTDRVDPTINNTTSYLDLSILYGVNQAQQNSVRDKDKGCGFLFPDAFAEDRLVLVPPAATALLVILSRNHNYVAGMLLSINERGYWKNPSTLTADQRIVQDEEIFQTARLVNCGHFMSLIFGDYVAGFLGLGRTGNSWSMNPFDPIKDDMGNLLGRGEGNHCSVEFSLLYRWHHTTAQKDVQWTEDLFAKLFNTTNFDTITLADFGPAVARAWETFVDPNPRTREFGGIHRGADGKFSDDDIARILQDSTDNPAAAYRARGIPDALRIIEVMGIVQGRQWGVCTMNEFRAFLGLKTFDDFEDWSSDEDVAQAARQLYGHIDNLELYPGLQAEDCIPLGPGSGICCGYTMTRAILADAICLVRGDRFYTTDYTPYNLTAWGFQDCARDPNNGAFGAALPKLLFRHLPRHYPADNVYGLFPFFTPATTKQNLTDLGIADKYKFNRPTALPIPKVVDTIQGIRNVFNDSVTFKTTYPTMQLLTEGYGFFLTFDSEKKQQHDKDKAWALHALYRDGDKNVMQGMVSYYVDSVKKLLKRESYKIGGIPGTRVDIVRNVINLMSVHWTADYLFDIDLKTEDNPMGLFTEQEVYDMLMVLFTCVFINVTPEHGWALTQGAIQVSGIINGLIQKSYNSVGSLLPPLKKKPWQDFMRRLAESKRPVKEAVAEVVGLAVGSSVNYAQALAQVVDFYLDSARSKELADIKSLIAKTDADSTERLRGYVREAQRLNSQFAGLFRVAAAPASVVVGNDKPNVDVKPGDIVFNSFKNANLDPHDFPNPTQVDPTRPKDSYQLQGGPGQHQCIGLDLVAQSFPEIFRVIFGLKNLRRAEDPAGHMANFMLNIFGTDNKMYIDYAGNWSPWPGSLTVVYDE